MTPAPEFQETQLTWVDKKSFPEELNRRLTQGVVSAQEADLLRQWHEYGYVILPNAVEEPLINALWDDYERAWRERPVCRIEVGGKGLIQLKDAPSREQMPHHRYRFQDFHNVSEAGRLIMLNPVVVRFIHLVFDDTPVGVASLVFEYGTQQNLHQDFAFVHLGFKIKSHLLATWVACEDIGPGQGPLFYYRGSHRIPRYDFGGGRIVHDYKDYSEIAGFEAHLQQQCERLGLLRDTFLGRKGDVLVWHGGLVHGGSSVTDRECTRKSYVCHYSSRSSYPRHHWALGQDPEVIELNGGIMYKQNYPGHVENLYKLPGSRRRFLERIRQFFR